ncbi:hypothetical protein, partial [Sinorhizobium meliloti]
VPSRLAKKDRFSEQNTSKTLKNRRLWTGTSLNPALHSLASISLFQHRAVSVAEVDQAIEHGQ